MYYFGGGGGGGSCNGSTAHGEELSPVTEYVVVVEYLVVVLEPEDFPRKMRSKTFSTLRIGPSFFG